MNRLDRMALHRLLQSAVLVACGLALGRVFHLVGLGSAFLPLHLPAQVGGLFLGPQAGLVTGLCTPLVSSVLTGMPPLVPMAVRMTVELGTYGLVAGLAHRTLGLRPLPALLVSILCGRLVLAVADSLVFWHLGLPRLTVPQNAWLALSFGFPGVVLQLVLVPAVVDLLHRHLGRHPSRRP